MRELATAEELGLDHAEMATIRAVLSTCPAVEEAWVYGSRAKDCYKPFSDIDIVLKGDNLIWDDKADLDLNFEESDLPYFVDLNIYHEIAPGDFLTEVDRWAKPIYRRESVRAQG